MRGLDCAEESAMQRLERVVELVAASDLPVILHGETGVGKEVTAERVHTRSRRSRAPYLKINCAALPDSMVESELFGHERGAFTGAVQAKSGLLEAARGGTVLLDEVTELTLPAQAKLLRALDNREVIRVGATRAIPIDVRFLAASNGDFQALITQGKLRADLYFRLNGITLEIPPLRARPGEILSLAAQFAAAAASRLGRAAPVIAASAQSFLLSYSWPGNVRELKNSIERATLLAQGTPIRAEHLEPDPLSRPVALAGSATAPPAPLAKSGSSAELWEELREHERERIVQAMAQAAGNRVSGVIGDRAAQGVRRESGAAVLVRLCSGLAGDLVGHVVHNIRHCFSCSQTARSLRGSEV